MRWLLISVMHRLMYLDEMPYQDEDVRKDICISVHSVTGMKAKLFDPADSH